MTSNSRWSFTALAVVFALLLWSLAFACYIAPGIATGRQRDQDTLYLIVTVALGFVFSCGFCRMVTGPLRSFSGRSRMGVAAAVLAALILAHAMIDLMMIEHYLKAKVVLPDEARVSGQGLLFLNNLLMLSPVYLMYAVGLGFGLSMRAIHERERRLAAALAEAQTAQLAMLRLQINPHFLFNSLNAVMSLVGSGRNRDAEVVVSRLAEFFRATLASEPNAMTSLEDELDVLGAYLEIEAARFGDRLRVAIDLPDSLADASVPHFLLQPIVENAIKHGVAPSKRPVTLSVSATAPGGRLRLMVEDDGAGGAPGAAGEGVGLRNVAARLRAHYGAGATLRSERLTRGFRVELDLPLAFVSERR
ncbi:MULTISPECIES: sensor histidine kinase [unclassified Phenylobacterium]|uniref:sensor histidine kinase n=1 Tax=unclassified Phenylobacterium TaxID=2640670 RepID=UPI00083A0BBA|nr:MULTISPECIES: histidine kinase [unclassified Phenylobacterium]